jgi:hypothetical protein
MKQFAAKAGINLDSLTPSMIDDAKNRLTGGASTEASATT